MISFGLCTKLSATLLGILLAFNSIHAQTPEFHSNPTLAFQAAAKSGKDVLLLFCNRVEEDCLKWEDFLKQNDTYFIWQFFDACIIFSDDFDGSVWASRYAVNTTPDVRLYPHPEGNYISLTSTEELYNLYRDKKQNEFTAETSAVIEKTDTLVPATMGESYTGEDGQNVLSQEEENIDLKKSDSLNLPTIHKIESPGLSKIGPGFYRIEAQKVHPPGFSVQIANFGTYAELLHYAERIQEILDLVVITEIARENEAIRYKVLLGNFPTREQAAALRAELLSIGIDGFVRKIE